MLNPMNLKLINLKQIMPTVLICGLSGGGLLIVSNRLSNNGWLSIPVYATVMIATVLVLKTQKRFRVTYLKAFVTLVLTFILTSYALYFYIITFINQDNGINVMGHIWRFLAILGLAVVSGAIMGLFFKKQNQNLAQTT